MNTLFFLQNASTDVCKVLVGNKLDAEDERVIATARGKSVSEVVVHVTYRFKYKKQIFS